MNELIGGAIWLFVACFAAVWLWRSITPGERALPPAPAMKVAEFSPQWTTVTTENCASDVPFANTSAILDFDDVQITVTISKDGDMWSVLWGKDLQNGIVGFGGTLLEAIELFKENFRHS